MRATTSKTNSVSQPGRVYSFVVIALAAVMIGISSLAIVEQIRSRDVTPSALVSSAKEAEISVLKSSNGLPNTLPRERLPMVLGIAVVLGTLSLVATRSQLVGANTPSQRDASFVAKHSGMPVLATLFQDRQRMSLNSPSKSRASWLPAFVFVSETTLAAAIGIAVYGCLTRPDLPQLCKLYLANPLDAYVDSLTHATNQLMGLFS